MSYNIGKLIRRVPVYILLWSCLILFVGPFLWIVSTSLKQDSQLFTDPLNLLPHPLVWSNYPDAIERSSFWNLLKNTIVVTFFTTLGVVVTCPLVAYSLAKLRWKGRSVLFAVTVSVMMVPTQVTMIPEFILFHKLGWIGTILPIIIQPVFGVPVYIFMLRQFFLGLPTELQEAARIDGASELRIYAQIMLPAALPAVLSAGLFQFMGSWNDFLGPLLYLNDPAQYTLSLGLQQFQSDETMEWSLLMAASICMTLPLVVLYFLLQKTFIQGITFTGIKG